MARQARRKPHAGWTWTALAVVTTAAVSVGACALLLPDRSPKLLASASSATSGVASVQQYSGSTQVTLVPTVSAAKSLLGNASGTVTENYTDGELRTGTRAYAVNGTAIIALHTETPMYRDLAEGDKGDDALALNDALNALGYSSSPGVAAYTAYTAAGWKQLMRDNGNDCDGSFQLADMLWIPSDVAAAGDWKATQGAALAAGDEVGSVAGGLTKLSVRGGKAKDNDRAISVFGVSGTLPAGSTDITDAETLAAVEASDDYQAMSAEERAAGLSATVTLTEPIDTLRVPAAAVFGISGSSGCIAANGGGKPQVIEVEIVSGELGASLVTFADSDGQLASVTSVALGETLSDLTCPTEG